MWPLEAISGTPQCLQRAGLAGCEAWIKIELYNVLDNDKLVRWDTSVTADPNSPKDANGLPRGYIPAANFGKAVQDNQFRQPVPYTNGVRLFRMAFGFSF